MNTQSKTLLFVLSLLFFSSVLPGEVVRFGAGVPWNLMENIGLEETRGWRGGPGLSLAPLDRKPPQSLPPELDLLLLADPNGARDYAGRYFLEQDPTITNTQTARGSVSIKLDGHPIVLNPTPGALWYPGSRWDGFTIEFRLRPTSLRNGETLFSWNGRDDQGRAQSVICRVHNRRLIWTFDGFFVHGALRRLTFSVESSPLVPGEWRHHRIRFSGDGGETGSWGASPGLLEYLVDNEPVDLTHATPDGREGTPIFKPSVGRASPSQVIIGSSFSGFLDEFRIESLPRSNAPPDRFINTTQSAIGIGRSSLIDTGYPSSSLESLRVRIDQPSNARVTFYALSSNVRSELQDTRLDADPVSDWMPLTLSPESEDPSGLGRWFQWNKEDREDLLGRYIVIGLVMEPDPGQDASPSLLAMEVDYQPRLPPRIPRDLIAESGAFGSVFLSWSGDAEADVAGWWVSAAPRPGTGTAETARWIPRENFEDDERPYAAWSPGEFSTGVVYFSVRAAWPEGSPSSLGIGDPRARSDWSEEIAFRP